MRTQGDVPWDLCQTPDCAAAAMLTFPYQPGKGHATLRADALSAGTLAPAQGQAHHLPPPVQTGTDTMFLL